MLKQNCPIIVFSYNHTSCKKDGAWKNKLCLGQQFYSGTKASKKKLEDVEDGFSTRSRIHTILNGHNLKWTPSRMYTIPNGHHPEWTQSRMDTIPNGHDPA